MNPATMLSLIDAANDTPRGAHVAAAFGLREDALRYLGGKLDNEHEIDRRIDKGSINQRNGYLSALYFLRPDTPAVRSLLLRRLRQQLVELLESEFLSTTYGAINRGWVLAVYLAADRIGDAEVASLALEIMRRVVAVEEALECPPNAHSDLKWRTVAPGGRTGDRNGMALERDQARAIETTGKPRWPMREGDREVEVWMVLRAVQNGLLPMIDPAPLNMIGTRWTLDIRYYEEGHEARFRNMERAIGALDAVSVDYRMSVLREGTHGGAVEWAGWDEWAPQWKGSRPEGRYLPWRNGAPELPRRNLGRLLREITVGGDLKTPEKPSNPRPEKPMPTKPKKPSDKDDRQWRHVKLPTDEGGEIIVKVTPPEADVEFLRTHRSGAGRG